MVDCNVVSNPEFFMLFCTSSKKISEGAIFYSLSTSGFITEASFNGKIYFMRSEEKEFKSLNNSIGRRYEFLRCTETEYSFFFLKVFCKLIYEVYLVFVVYESAEIEIKKMCSTKIRMKWSLKNT